MTRQRILTVGLLAGTAFLAACGGGGSGGGIASTPTPAQPGVVREEFRDFAPLESNPAWSSGNYETIAINRNSESPEPEGAVRISVDAASKTYELTVSTGGNPALSASFDFNGDPPIGTRYVYVLRRSDGSTEPGRSIYYKTSEGRQVAVRINAETRIDASLRISGPEPRPIGSVTPPSRYTALGDWEISESKRQSDGSFQDTGQGSAGYFAFGDRTPAADIPASGTATYSVIGEQGDYSQCDYGCTIPGMQGTTNLTVDFAARAIEAAYRWSSASPIYGSGGSQQIGTAEFSIDAGGRSPIENSGSFAIELAGTGIAHFARNDGASQPDQTVAVDGQIAGAFFGLRAVEIGGVYRIPGLGLNDFSLPGLGDSGNLVATSSQGAFVAVQD